MNDIKNIIIPENEYYAQLNNAYYCGAIGALIKIGKTIPEIATILKVNESFINAILFLKNIYSN